jgi:predicted 3-demethylubiquinone-9 3-methyltransferase (glyoxalase superfamily)
MQKVTPFLWFDNDAEEAVNFYTSVFKNSKAGNMIRYDENAAKASGKPAGSIMTAPFEIAGQKFTALNGGPVFKFTHAHSFFIQCETENEIDTLWEKLSENSPKIFWPLKEYPFSKKYGWVTDKFRLSWQLNLTNTPQKIAPFLMFDGRQHGKAEEAINFYTSLFNDSKINSMMRYGPENKECEGLIVHSVFRLSGQEFIAMDSGMPDNINFNESVSYVVNCESQEEVDYYWNKLSAVPESEQCGWLKDKYGVSWQIVPSILFKLMSDPDTAKAQRVTRAMLKMKKLYIAVLENA